MLFQLNRKYGEAVKDYHEIVQGLEKKLKQEPDNVIVLNDLAIALMEVLRYEDSLEYFQQAARLFPSIQSLHNLAYFYYAEGEPAEEGWWASSEDKAVHLLEKAIEQKPISHFPYTLLGRIYAGKEDYERAIPLLEQAITLKPTLENLNNLGVCFYFTSRLNEAADCFHQASLLRGENNSSLHPLLSYGVCLARLGIQSEARQVANELLRLCKESDSDLDEDDIPSIFYEIYDFADVIELYQHTKLRYATYWVPQYLYALHQCGDKAKMNDVFDKELLFNENEIEETNQDDGEDWEEGRKEEYIAELKADISLYKTVFNEIVDGKSPPSDYKPSIESNCYLFGCTRHNNSNYLEN